MNLISSSGLHCAYAQIKWFALNENDPLESCDLLATHEVALNNNLGGGPVCADHAAVLVRQGFKDVSGE